jgi:hypothetical protein
VIRRPLLILAAVAALAAAQQAMPTAVLTRRGAVTLTLPASILQSSEVRKHIGSGLTTAFVIQVECGERKGGARVSVRYDLWEETYLVRTIDATGREQNSTVASEAKLAEWWSTAALPVIAGGAESARLDVRVHVLPFSAREEAETKRWLSRILTSMGSVKDAPVDKRSDAGAAKILDVIVSTSIQRRPILEYQWTVDARTER